MNGPLGPGTIAAGGQHSLLATTDGRVYGWGANANGQLGDLSTAARLTPTLLNTITGVTQVAAGASHTVARLWDGQVYAWGHNGSGRLGDGTTTQRTRPTLIPTLANIIAVAAGDTHSLALGSDGRVYAWGGNTNGQLGLGSTTGALVPTEIPALSGVVAIAAGASHSFAVTAAGQLYAWGLNAHSRLGDGTVTQRTSPVLVSLPNVVSVAAGAAHSVALTADGQVYTWGLGSSGQLGLGSTTTMATPTLVPTAHATAIAAGDHFTAAIRHDGVLVAWGANDSGQVGDTTTVTRTAPAIAAGPASLSLMSLGDAHALAVTPDGSLWTWGNGLAGRLGDSLTTSRATPQSVLSGLASWVLAAPTVSVPSSALHAALEVSVLSSTVGADIRYTLTGVLPTAADALVPATGLVPVSSSSMLRARAFLAGRAPSAIARADYQLQAPAPVIDPLTGVYQATQTVTLSSVDPSATVRYTLDGTDPTPASAIYTAPFAVSTTQTIKARAYPTNGFDPSAVSLSILSFGLAAPTASPSGGLYPAAPTVTLSSIAGASIRYTLNGTTPTATSMLYTSPVPIPAAGATLKSVAFHPDWPASAVGTQTYIIDSAPPTIIAKRFPLPLANWQRTPVTVTFVCADNVGIATCPSPQSVSLEGSGQTVSGTAVDQVGREATAQETVNVDLTPPVVTLTTPVDGLVTASASVVVTAAVSDALSGVGIVNCNGIATPVVDGVVTCTAALRPGRNAITVSARDVAGHSSSAGVMVTRASTATRLTLSPAARTLLVDETATLSLRDDFGVPAPGATWSSTNPAVVALSTDDPPVLTALVPGTSSVIATRNGLSSVSTITVVAGTLLADGSTGLAEGTTRWTVAPTPAPNSSWFEGPIYTHPIDASGPDMFMVETNTTTWERTLRAVSASGEVEWLAAAPGVPLMGDMFGGVVAGIEPSPLHCMGSLYEVQRCDTALTRFAGPAGTATWRYDSPGLVDRPAQGPDGTVYVIEHVGDYLYVPNTNGPGPFAFPGEKSVVILDGATGVVTARVPLNSTAYEPLTVGPIVGGDGFGYLLVANDTRLSMRRLSRDGQVAEDVIVQGACTTNCSGPTPGYLMPDGVGGLLITANWNSFSQGPVDYRLTHLDGAGGRTDTAISPGEIELVGQDGTAYLRVSSGATTVSQPVMDVATWIPRWHLPVEWTLLAASPDGGAVAQNAVGELARFGGTGQLLATTPALGLRNPVQQFGSWVGNSDYGLRAVAGTFDDATRWNAIKRPILFTQPEQYGFGGRQQNLAQRNPGRGVFLKTHDAYTALTVFQHVSIRVAPTNQAWLLYTRPDLIGGTDQYGNVYFTLGAGTVNGDTSSGCTGVLTNGTNRPTDVNLFNKRSSTELPVATDHISQGAAIVQLLSAHGRYTNTVPYFCFPETVGAAYNSNSYAHGLLHAAGLPHSERAPGWRSVPGWRTPVPNIYFP